MKLQEWKNGENKYYKTSGGSYVMVRPDGAGCVRYRWQDELRHDMTGCPGCIPQYRDDMEGGGQALCLGGEDGCEHCGSTRYIGLFECDKPGNLFNEEEMRIDKYTAWEKQVFDGLPWRIADTELSADSDGCTITFTDKETGLKVPVPAPKEIESLDAKAFIDSANKIRAEVLREGE